MIDYDDEEVAELRRQRNHERRMRNALARHPDPRDPDHPIPDEPECCNQNCRPGRDCYGYEPRIRPTLNK